MTPQRDETQAILVFKRHSPPRDSLRAYVDDQGYQVYDASTPAELTHILSACDIRLTLMDIGDAGPDALSSALAVFQNRGDRLRPPIIVMGTRNTMSDRVVALDMGADRYLAHPFTQRELLAHMRALARHAFHDDGVSPGDLCFRGWKLQPARHRLLTPAGEEVVLTHGEFRILAAFVDNPGMLLSRADLKAMADIDDTGKTARVVDLMISRLRGKLRRGLHGDTLIRTRHGKGYVFAASVRR